MNHCCDPNASELYEAQEIFIVARRPIEAGDEITFDYNMSAAGGSSWPCRSGASRCLGRTKGDYFLLPEDRQLEYLPLLAPWFIERHRQRIDQLRRKLLT